MIRTIQYSFPSKADGLEISCLAVVPELGRDEKYKGIIQIVHGMSEYKERYLPFMESRQISGISVPAFLCRRRFRKKKSCG